MREGRDTFTYGMYCLHNVYNAHVCRLKQGPAGAIATGQGQGHRLGPQPMALQQRGPAGGRPAAPVRPDLPLQLKQPVPAPHPLGQQSALALGCGAPGSYTNPNGANHVSSGVQGGRGSGE